MSDSPNPSWRPKHAVSAPSGDTLTFDPGKMDTRECYKLMIGTIVPRPIAFVTTINSKEQVNLAPFSFFNGVSSHPPCLSISVAYQADGSKKDTLRNIDQNGEFVVNSANRWLIEPLVHSAGNFPYGTNEMQEVGLTPLPSEIVRPPRVREASVQFECRLHSRVAIGPEVAGSSVLVVGEIVRIHINERVYRELGKSYDEFAPIARLGGFDYCELGSRFSLKPPKF
ncbi:MAG: flavin reductase family protein [Bdellovibrionales bacterium]|nr:flavin reductase family protein [Bdellovibrionales bacterium]